MSNVEGDTGRWGYRKSVRTHASEPLRAAEAHVECEQRELDAEAEALERFAADVDAMTTVSKGGTAVFQSSDRPAECERVRDRYRETVMAVDHYEAVYDEPLLANVASELGADIAAAIGEQAGVPFSSQLQSLLERAAADAAARRREFSEKLAAERQSLVAAREGVRELTVSIGGSGLAPAQVTDFDDRLDRIVRKRQHRLHSRASYRQDGHDLCEYVYDDEPWTYPVLTAATRLRDSVV